jgi:surfeit locus 1 family protein
MNFRFTPKLWPTLGAAALIALTAWACQWQYFKGVAKRAQVEQRAALEARGPIDLTLQRVSTADLDRTALAKGQWLVDKAIFLDNRSHGQQAGYHLIVPMALSAAQNTQTAQTQTVLVNLGWLKRGSDYPKVPKLEPQSLPSMTQGVLVAAQSRYVELAQTQPQGALWQNLDLAKYRQQTGLQVSDVMLLAQSPVSLRVASADSITLKPAELAKGVDADRHFGYALQWGALATLTLLLWIGLNVRRTNAVKP